MQFAPSLESLRANIRVTVENVVFPAEGGTYPGRVRLPRRPAGVVPIPSTADAHRHQADDAAGAHHLLARPAAVGRGVELGELPATCSSSRRSSSRASSSSSGLAALDCCWSPSASRSPSRSVWRSRSRRCRRSRPFAGSPRSTSTSSEERRSSCRSTSRSSVCRSWASRPNKYLLGIIVLALNSSAYLAEIFRAGIQSISQGPVRGGVVARHELLRRRCSTSSSRRRSSAFCRR